MAQTATAKTYTEIALLVLAQESVKALDGVPPAHLKRRAVKRAMEELTKLGRHDLAADLGEAQLGDRRRRRRVPALGTDRPYKVQASKDGHFARIPTEPIGRVKGERVRAHFIEDVGTVSEVLAHIMGPVVVVAAEPKETRDHAAD